MVTRKKSIAKAITYRLSSTLITVVIAYVLTGEASTALSIGGLSLIIKVGWYFLHERIWERVNWGRDYKMFRDFDVVLEGIPRVPTRKFANYYGIPIDRAIKIKNKAEEISCEIRPK
ncbi:hypothetical protein LCGC14_0773150 [marine sediment metagenome]|uniref:DUF2061 domain-containing protein n=1 Tax=marine sediment metagenome TaxID=412755 RepID=A0A0F9QHK4_9ZZZZ